MLLIRTLSLNYYFMSINIGIIALIYLIIINNLQCMLPVSPVFHTAVTVTIGLKNKLIVGTSIPLY